LNRTGGIAALVGCIRGGASQSCGQAGAALANACANCSENQNAARHAGAISVLCEFLKSADSTTEVLEICSASIRNLCSGSPENTQELLRCGGVAALLFIVRSWDSHAPLREYALGALWKLCATSADAIQVVQSTGAQHIRFELQRVDCTEEIKRCVNGVLELVQPNGAEAEEGPGTPQHAVPEPSFEIKKEEAAGAEAKQPSGGAASGAVPTPTGSAGSVGDGAV